MKRYIVSIALVCLALNAWAQDTYYAELMSRNNYYGTARSVALGNAMTALGGDLGSIGINPAGSAVNSFCQFTVTPGLLFQTTGAQWGDDNDPGFGQINNTTHTKFNLPNMGVTLAFETGRDVGVKTVTIGVVANNSNTFLNYSTARGVSNYHSFLGNLAAAAAGTSYKNLNTDLYTAYCANQIGEYGPEGSNIYSGANQMIDKSERYHYVPGDLDQTSYYNTYGSKTDLVFNLGYNVSDKFYFGFNLGFPFGQYRREDIFIEAAQSPVSFPVNFVDDNGNHLGKEGEPTTYYKSSQNGYYLNTDIGGIYGKTGFIWLPFAGLRIGAAIQTPALLNLKEEWWYTAKTNYEDNKYDGSAISEAGEYEYRLRTPYVVDAGIAYTFGGFGLVSVDYELTDYSVMKFQGLDSYEDREFWNTKNECNKLFCGVSHSVRAGLEVKPSPAFAIRAGYSLITDPEKFAYDTKGNKVTAETWEGLHQLLSGFEYFNNTTQAYSLGLGYSSSGSFFADATVRLTSYPTAYYSPYYYGGYDMYDKDGRHVYMGQPLITLNRRIVDVLVTFGWRF